MSVNEADFFGDGVLKGGFVYKAHLRVPVRPHPIAAAQDAIDELSGVHAACSSFVREAVTSAAAKVLLDVVVPLRTIAKAGAPQNLPGAGQFRIKHPGLRGGKWWRDKAGNIRYGAQPGPSELQAKKPVAGEDLSHYGPSPFGHARASHAEVLQQLANSKDHDFSKGELGFLDWWHDRGVRNLVEQYGGMSTDDLDRGVGGMRFQNEAGDMSYEEAAHDFFASQDWGGADFDSDVAPLLGDLLGRFHDAAGDAKLSAAIEKRQQAKTMRWFARAARQKAKLRRLGTVMSSPPDSSITAQRVISALALMDLIQDLRKEGITVATPNDGLLREGVRRLGSFLQQRFGKAFSSLSSVQLMLAYIGASLNAIWDPKANNYYTGGGVPVTTLGGKAMANVAEKSGLGGQVNVLKNHLNEVTLEVANVLNGGAS